MRFQNHNWILPPHILAFLKEDAWYDIKESEDTRSLRQNALLHGYIYSEAIEAFRRKSKILNSEQVHWFFKTQFLKKRKKCPVTGRYKYKEWSTANLSTKAFSKYVEDIRLWVYDTLEYDIQPPVDNEELKYYDNQM